MNAEDRIKQWKLHDSIRGVFALELYKQMALNKNIVLLTGDLGYGIFDSHKEDFKDRYYNCGASEQAMIGIAVGLALSGKIPFCYSITPFLIYRPFETIKLYLEHERIAVKLIGSGVGEDYKEDGISHDAQHIHKLFYPFTDSSIQSYFPTKKEEIPDTLKDIINNDKPCFLGLRRI
jgi:transketolase